MASVAIIWSLLEILETQVLLQHDLTSPARPIHPQTPQHLPPLRCLLGPVRNVVELQGWNLIGPCSATIHFEPVHDTTACLYQCHSYHGKPRCRFVTYNLDNGECFGFSSDATWNATVERNDRVSLLSYSGKKFDRKERYRVQESGFLVTDQGLRMFSLESCLALCHILPQCTVATFDDYTGACWVKAVDQPVQLVNVEVSSRGIISYVS